MEKILATLILFFISLTAVAKDGLEEAFIELISKSSKIKEVCKPIKQSLLIEQSNLRKYRDEYNTPQDIILGGVPNNPLGLSVIANDYESAKFHIKAKTVRTDGIVVWFVRYADISLLEMALVNGLDPNISSGGMQSALTEAATTGLIEEAKLLIKYGADINYRLGNGSYSLDYSVGCEHKEVSQLLIDRGAKMSDSSMLKAKELGLILR